MNDNELNTTNKIEGQPTINKRSKTTYVCGTSPHLSTFAIFLSNESSTECVESDFFWPAIGLVLSVWCCLLLFMLAEWRIGLVKRLILGEKGMELRDFRKQMKEQKMKSSE